MVAATSANGHRDHPDHASGGSVEMFPGEGVAIAGDKRHDADDGHLPPVQRNVTLVGKAEITNPSGDGNDGPVGDGAFIDEGGNDFWGVEVWHDEHGEQFVLGSDRNFGLYVLQYTP